MIIKRIIKKYHDQLYTHKFDNVHDREQLLERHNLPKLTQEEKDHLNRPPSIKEVESIINGLPK